MLTISFIFYVGFCQWSKITKQRRLPTIPDNDRASTRLPQLPENSIMIGESSCTVPDDFHRHVVSPAVYAFRY